MARSADAFPPGRFLAVPLAILCIGAAIVLVAPLLPAGQTYPMRVATQCALLCALANSWNLVGGLTGYPTFATAGFFGLGAYATAISEQAGQPGWAGFAIAVVVAAALAAPFGFSILRLRGHYFAIASLMLVGILREVTTGWASLTGGGMGLNVPGGASDPEITARISLQSAVALAAFSLALSAFISKSWLGFGLSCIRMNETAAAGAGIDAPLLKTISFTLSAMIAAVAGGVYASWIGYIDPSDVFDVMWSVRPIVAVLIGGIGTVFGPLIGSLVFIFLEEVFWRNILTFATGALGIFIVLLLLLLPRGILPSFHRSGRFGFLPNRRRV
jgi:branched-chain amino acid transport system permease protein